MTVADAAHYSLRLRFAFICGDSVEMFGEALSYGALFSAGFGGSLSPIPRPILSFFL